MSLARDFLGALWSPTAKQVSHKLVVAGVALPLKRVLVEMSAGALKVMVDSTGSISPFGVWDLSSTKEFIKLCCGLESVDVPLVEKYVFPVFRGRYRFLATALEIKMATEKSLKEAAILLRDVIGMPAAVASEIVGVSLAKTMHDSILQVERHPELILQTCEKGCDKCGTGGECTRRVNLISFLENSTIRYFLQRKPYLIVEPEAVNDLIQSGIARTRPEGGGAVIDEFLVLQAYLTHRGGISWLREVAMDHIVNITTSTGKGDMYQQLVALCFLQMWTRHQGKLSRIFEDVLADPSCPEELKEELNKGRVILLEGICPLQLSESFARAKEEFLDAPEGLPGDSSLLVRPGKDIIGRGKHEDGRSVQFSIQTKLLDHDMAMDDSSPRCWNTKTTIFLAFLVVVPRKRTRKFLFGRNPVDPQSFELIITVGEENADRLFNSQEMVKLGYEKPLAERKRQRTKSF